MMVRPIGAVLMVCAVLAGCGIPAEQQPRPLPTGPATQTASPADTPRPTLEQQLTLWFVREGKLVPVQRTATGPLTSQGYLDLLAEGPTLLEQAQGIRTAVVSVVTGKPLVVTAQKAKVKAPDTPDNEVAIVLEPAFKDLLAAEQVLVLGEVVVTVAVDPIDKVLFVDEDGQTLGVPTADGRLANGPVGPQDYAALIG